MSEYIRVMNAAGVEMYIRKWDVMCFHPATDASKKEYPKEKHASLIYLPDAKPLPIQETVEQIKEMLGVVDD